MRWPDLPWRPPRAFGRGRPLGPPRLIVIHYTAGSERSTSAEDGAAYDARRTDGVSTHYFVDSDSVVQCVDTDDRANAALYHGNRWGIQYELCGTVQTRVQWLDAASRATIRNAARQIARDMRHHDIPLVRLIGRQVRPESARGICGHADCTTGWPEDRGTHMDPGTQFPWDVLFSDIREFLAPAPEAAPLTPGGHAMTALVRAPGKRAVWVVDIARGTRRWVQTEAEQAQLQALMRWQGVPEQVHEWAGLKYLTVEGDDPGDV